MKILKKGNYFKAYCTEENEGNTRFKIGDYMGSISIKTENFIGATVCLIELTEHLDKYNMNKLITIYHPKKDSLKGTIKIEPDELGMGLHYYSNVLGKIILWSSYEQAKGEILKQLDTKIH